MDRTHCACLRGYTRSVDGPLIDQNLVGIDSVLSADMPTVKSSIVEFRTYFNVVQHDSGHFRLY